MEMITLKIYSPSMLGTYIVLDITCNTMMMEVAPTYLFMELISP
jgi:hypothetical protein